MKKSDRKWHREKAMLERLPEDERIMMEDIFKFNEEQGDHFTAGFEEKPGTYIPEKLGLPFKFGNPLAPRRMATHWARLLGGKRVVTLTPTDEHLSRAFKGDLLRSGRWEKSVIAGPLEGLLKAHQIQKMVGVRDQMIAIGRNIPENVDDVMIPVHPQKWSDQTRSQARNMADILDAMDAGDAIDAQQLSKVDAQAIEAVKDYMFPGLADSASAEVAKIAKQAMKEPIPEVVWVPRSLLKKTGLFDGGAPHGALFKYGVGTADTLNNLMKMMTLSLNPAYYPMNMAGQMIMLGSQLGWSTPFSVYRSVRQWKNMSGEDLALIDRFADIGFAGSQMLSKGGLGQRATDAVGKVGTVLIDKYPRRASFFHEARRIGYKTEADIHRLVNDVDNIDDLMKVHDRVNHSMVDYGNLNKFERDVVTRLIFVYPWLRGSSRYAAQFPFDHPIQAAAFAGLVYWQQNRLKKALPGGHPGYLKWYFPLDTPKDGENPYGFRMDQLATPLQTLDLASMLVDWSSGGHANLPWGSNEEGAASMLGPLAEEIEKTVTGWDSFTQQQVSTGLPDLFLRILDPRERWASWTRLKRIMDHQTHKGIYDTTQTQNWLRLFLGSLAPINIDSEKAAAQATLQRGTPSLGQSRDAWVKKVTEITGSAPPPEVVQWKQNDQVFSQQYRAYRKENEIEGESTDQERVAILCKTQAELHPDNADYWNGKAEQAMKLDDDTAQAVYEAGREALGLSQLAHLNNKIGEAQRAQRTATP